MVVGPPRADTRRDTPAVSAGCNAPPPLRTLPDTRVTHAPDAQHLVREYPHAVRGLAAVKLTDEQRAAFIAEVQEDWNAHHKSREDAALFCERSLPRVRRVTN